MPHCTRWDEPDVADSTPPHLCKEELTRHRIFNSSAPPSCRVLERHVPPRREPDATVAIATRVYSHIIPPLTSRRKFKSGRGTTPNNPQTKKTKKNEDASSSSQMQLRMTTFVKAMMHRSASSGGHRRSVQQRRGRCSSFPSVTFHYLEGCERPAWPRPRLCTGAGRGRGPS